MPSAAADLLRAAAGLKTIGVKHPELCKALGEPWDVGYCWVGLPLVPGSDPQICWGLLLWAGPPWKNLDFPEIPAVTLGLGLSGRSLESAEGSGEPDQEPSVQSSEEGQARAQ